MAIQRWDPVRDLIRLQETVNRLFEDVLGRSSSPGGEEDTVPGGWHPALDLIEESGRYVVRADLPGVAPGEVDVLVEKGHLVLRGERRNDQGVAMNSYLRIERPRGRFSARLHLPASVDTQRIEASQQNGVLEILLPKRQEETAGTIEVAGA